MEQQNSLTAGSIPAEVRARIIDAANQLFQDGGAERFPSVADVRRLAKTDMNATSAVMRDWKRQQSAKPAPVAVSVPEPVQQAALEQSAVVWLAAQELANASLRAAQDAWAVERAEMEGMRQELAQLFEAQAVELESLRQALVESTKAKEEAETAAEQLAERLNIQQSRAEQAETRAEEIEHRVSDLKEELAHAHEETATLKSKVEAIEGDYSQQLDQLQVQLLHLKEAAAICQGENKAAVKDAAREAKRAEALQAERNQALQEATTAREDAAHIRGQLEAVQKQNEALLERLGKPKDQQ